MPTGTLYLVGTPIGNLKDITLRALETLRACDVIYCEDTRHSRKLLSAHGIAKPTGSFHQFSDDTVVAAPMVKAAAWEGEGGADGAAELAKARRCLAGVYAQYTEGFAFPDLQEAAALIARS